MNLIKRSAQEPQKSPDLVRGLSHHLPLGPVPPPPHVQQARIPHRVPGHGMDHPLDLDHLQVKVLRPIQRIPLQVTTPE